MKATGLPTKKAVVEEGLRLLIKVKGQEGIRRLRGKVEWKGDLSGMREGRIKACFMIIVDTTVWVDYLRGTRHFPC